MPDQEAMTTQSSVETEEGPETANLGEMAPHDFSMEEFAKLSEAAKGALLELDKITDQADVAARRLEVEQAWEALHFDRGYQHLFHNNKGGWVLPGQTYGNGKSAPNYQAQHSTNIYSAEGDIICAALQIEVPRTEFFPRDPDYGPDQLTADQSNDFKEIWATNNNLQKLLGECARIFWNEDRALLYTRYVLDGQKYGFQKPDDEEVPLVPQDLDNPPSPEPTGQEGDDEFNDALSAPKTEGDEATPEVPNAKIRKALGMEVTSVHGKLDHKVPIGVDHVEKMHFVKLFYDLDESLVKAMFPWIEDKISPGSDGTSEVELDRIARENVRQAVLGAYVTGDSMRRHVVVKHSWFRPSNFYDKSVKDEVRAELLEAFPDGCLLVKAGAEYAYSRNENMDEHLEVIHAVTGKGQNRRALGTAMLSVQKRINDWVDLLDSFFRRTVPKKWMNSEAFNMEELKKGSNTPGSTGPFNPIPGLTTQDQYMMVEPTPQPQPALPDYTKYFMEGLSEKITGAVPSMFGGATNTDTLGGIQIQRDQALQRIGPAWNSIQWGFCTAAKQAVCCAAACRNDAIVKMHIPGKGKVAVDCSKLKGNVLAYPESTTSFPESWAQREDKILMLMDGAKGSPEMQKLMMTPENLPVLADALRMKRFYIPGADSVKKQQGEFEMLLRTGPKDNVDLMKHTQTLKAAQIGMQQAKDSGQPVPPEAAGMVQQLQQHISTMPPQVTSVPVAQDDTEEHVIEAATCLKWLRSPEGQRFKYGDPQQQASYQNVVLHYQAHQAMAKQIAAQNTPPEVQKPPSQSISANLKDMPSTVQAQVLTEMGLKVTPATFEQQKTDSLNRDIAKKVVPEHIAVNKTQQPAQRTLRR